MKIKRVKIEGFKCLGSVEADLRPFTVLIGPNDSGKSSFMQAINMVAMIARTGKLRNDPIKNYLWTIGRKIMLHGKTTSQVIHIKLALELNGERNSSYELTLVPDEPEKEYAIEKEEVVIGQKRLALERSDRERNFMLHFIKNGESGSKSSGNPYVSVLSHFQSSSDMDLNEFKRMKLFHFDPESPARDSKSNTNLDIIELIKDGSGLPTLLANLALTNRERIVAIEKDLQGITKGSIVSISTPQKSIPKNIAGQLAEEVHFGLEFKLSSGLVIPASQISTGILYSLCILTMVHHPGPPGIIFLEEPENSVHPSRLEEIIRYLRLLTTRKDGPTVQIVMATHSPYLLDHCKPEEVLIFRRDPETRLTSIARVDAEAFREKKWALALGEMWGSYGEEGLLKISSSRKARTHKKK
jgi:predicted ATPase